MEVRYCSAKYTQLQHRDAQQTLLSLTGAMALAVSRQGQTSQHSRVVGQKHGHVSPARAYICLAGIPSTSIYRLSPTTGARLMASFECLNHGWALSRISQSKEHALQYFPSERHTFCLCTSATLSTSLFPGAAHNGISTLQCPVTYILLLDVDPRSTAVPKRHCCIRGYHTTSTWKHRLCYDYRSCLLFWIQQTLR